MVNYLIAFLFILTLLTFVTSNSSSSSQLLDILSGDILAGKLSTEASTVSSAATDFGGTTKIFPTAVLNPSSVDDIAKLIKMSYNSPVSFPIAARGHGHSLRGQAAVEGGVVVNMRSLKQEHRERDGGGSRGLRRSLGVSPEGSYADVGGEWLWIEVLNATLEFGLSPVSWTDYLYLTVGGTLSNGGISGQTFRYGPQINNVVEMDVITGKGEMVTCSKYMNSELFYSVLGGLGQFGIITRARIPLHQAPKRVKWLRFLYDDFSKFTKDQERLISETNGFDFLEGSLMLHHGSPDNWRSTYFPLSDHSRIISMVKKYRIIYCLEVVKHYDEISQHTINEEIEELTEGLKYVKGYMYEKDVTYTDFLNRVRTGELKLRSEGRWENPHPWLNLFVPKSRIYDFHSGVFQEIVLRNNITTGPILVYPMNKNKWDEEMTTIIPEEEVFYTIGFLHSSSKDDWENYVKENIEILKYCEGKGMKVKEYLPYHSSSQEWRNHFGSKWNIFINRKNRYDPRFILSPGQNIF